MHSAVRRRCAALACLRVTGLNHSARQANGPPTDIPPGGPDGRTGLEGSLGSVTLVWPRDPAGALLCYGMDVSPYDWGLHGSHSMPPHSTRTTVATPCHPTVLQR
jgi:hypothetical protein